MDVTKEGKYFSKEHPEDLMPQEILERVPELYGQEDVAFAETDLFAAYVILSAQTGPGISLNMIPRPIMPSAL